MESLKRSSDTRNDPVYTGKICRLALSKRERTTPGANSQPSSGMDRPFALWSKVGEFTWTDGRCHSLSI